jgi:hypothetical protein
MLAGGAQHHNIRESWHNIGPKGPDPQLLSRTQAASILRFLSYIPRSQRSQNSLRPMSLSCQSPTFGF